MEAVVVGTVFAAAAIVILWQSLRGRRGAFLGLALLLGAASVANTIAAITNPSAYSGLYGDRALIPLYRDILHGMSPEQARVVVLLVAACQLGIAVLLALRRMEVLALTGPPCSLWALPSWARRRCSAWSLRGPRWCCSGGRLPDRRRRRRERVIGAGRPLRVGDPAARVARSSARVLRTSALRGGCPQGRP